jgi:hypothetical protein
MGLVLVRDIYVDDDLRHRDLLAYAQALGRETGQSAIEPAKLVPPMLTRFMATDRAFARARKQAVSSKSP